MEQPRSCGCLVYPPGAPHDSANCPTKETDRVLFESLLRMAKQPGGVLEVIPIGPDAIRAYLDAAIHNWRKIRDEEMHDPAAKLQAVCYIDAFQSVRTSLFGATLPDEETT